MSQTIAAVSGLCAGLYLASLPNPPHRVLLVVLAAAVGVLWALWRSYRRTSQTPAADAERAERTPPPLVARMAPQKVTQTPAAPASTHSRAELERWDVLRTVIEGAPVHGLGRRAWAGKRTGNGTRISQGAWSWAFDTLRAANAIRQNGQGWELAAPPADVLAHFGLSPSGTGRLFTRSTPPADATHLVRV